MTSISGLMRNWWRPSTLARGPPSEQERPSGKMSLLASSLRTTRFRTSGPTGSGRAKKRPGSSSARQASLELCAMDREEASDIAHVGMAGEQPVRELVICLHVWYLNDQDKVRAG